MISDVMRSIPTLPYEDSPLISVLSGLNGLDARVFTFVEDDPPAIRRVGVWAVARGLNAADMQTSKSSKLSSTRELMKMGFFIYWFSHDLRVEGWLSFKRWYCSAWLVK